MRAFLLILGLLTPLAATVAAQDATPYVPLDHWATPYIEHLISAGVIRDPTPLTRPLKQGAVVRALLAADTGTVGPSVRRTIRRLLREWAGADPVPHYRVEMSVGA